MLNGVNLVVVATLVYHFRSFSPNRLYKDRQAIQIPDRLYKVQTECKKPEKDYAKTSNIRQARNIRQKLQIFTKGVNTY